MSHAVLSPSGAHRWLNCPPSARLELKFPDSNSQVAEEGTFAHKWAEVNLQHFTNQIGDAEYEVNIDALKQDKFYSRILEEYVDEYLNVVIEKFIRAKKVDKNAVLLLEQKFDLSEYIPEGYGHADAVIISNGTLEVVDLKYGAGVPVRAENNPQLRLYALGAYEELSFLYDFSNVKMTIVQPRNGGVSSETLTTLELIDWGNKIKPIALLAFAGGGEFHAGDHCKFCRAASRCKIYADYQMEIVKEDFDDPDLLNDDDISAILKRADDVIKWLNNVKSFALKEAVEHGKHWLGFKLVEGRSNREITDAEKAAEILKENGGTDEQIWKPKELLGLTALEKNFGKKKIAELLSEVIIKPAGAPKLADENDERPDWRDPRNDFDNLDNPRLF